MLPRSRVGLLREVAMRGAQVVRRARCCGTRLGGRAPLARHSTPKSGPWPETEPIRTVRCSPNAIPTSAREAVGAAVGRGDGGRVGAEGDTSGLPHPKVDGAAAAVRKGGDAI